MNGIRPIAKIITGRNTEPGVYLLDSIKDSELPYMLQRSNLPSVRLTLLLKWLEDRVVPKERYDIAEVLSLMGLKEYKVMDIAKQTKASLIDDDYWIKFFDTDDYYKDTLRGRAKSMGVF